MDKSQPIGVIDSGVGGLTVLKWLQVMMPQKDFIFIGKGRTEVCFTADLERGKRLTARMMDVDQCEFKLIDLKD